MATPTQSVPRPEASPELASEIAAILTGAAVALLTDRAYLRITGPDAPRWLNGMVTNAIQALQPGEGNYNFLLNAQGQIQADCTIYRDPDASPPEYVLESDRAQIDTVQQLLDKFIIMDDVELKPVDAYPETVLILGPKAPQVLQNLGTAANLWTLSPLRLAYAKDLNAQVTTPSPTFVPQFEISTGSGPALLQQLTAAGATEVSAAALEAFRILSGTPRYGIDIRPRDLPQETAQTRALHFSKGCYLGQEIVERIRSRGNVHRTFTGFELTGELPAPGTPLTAQTFDRPIGEITSAAVIPLPGRTVKLALGYIRNEALERKVSLEYPGGSAVPVALPYSV